MIGRFAGAGVAADIGGRRVATVAAAAALLVIGGLVDAAGHRQAGAALALASLSLTGLPIVWRAVRGLARLESNVDELVSLAIVASLLLGEWASAAIVAFIMVLGSLIEEFVSARARRHLEALVAAMSRAAREGLLVKGGRYVEGCARVAAIAFDKTGTLTKGECRVMDVVPTDGSTQAGLLAAAARLEAAADHPLARAIQARAVAEGVAVLESLSILREAGLGITGRDGDAGEAWRLGNARFMARHGIDVGRLESDAERLRARGLSIVYVARGSHAQGLLSIEDEVRPEARDVIAELRADGLHRISILSGDARAVTLAVAADVGVDPADVEAELLPEQKYDRVQDLERRQGRICYVGDGANDGPALSVATVGVSLGSRHDTVALETAAVVLMRNSLTALPFLFRLSRRTTRTINQNLVLFGLMFNAAMLALSSIGILTPILGAPAHNVGSVSVVINSARLLLFERAPAVTSSRPPQPPGTA